MTLFVPCPTSKSMTQRALVIAALAEKESVIVRPLECDDSRHLCAALTELGATIEWRHAEARVVPAPLPLKKPAAPLFCGNAGTAVRFTAPLALLCDGDLVVDGDEHMRKRPIGPLAESLAELGVDVAYLAEPGFPPLALGRRRAPPARVAVDTSLSSQYASGLLLVAPLLERGLELELTGHAVSRPYLDMTVAMMRAAGASAAWTGERALRVEPGRYRGHTSDIEVDWSAAAFILAAARITGRDVRPEGLAAADSLQGDAAIARLLDGFDRAEINAIDLTDAPDLIAPLAAAALFAARPTRIRGAAHTRVKECDRVAVLARELGKIGARVAEHDDGLDIEPLPAHAERAASLDPEGDHRMAMTFGLISLRIGGIRVENRACVSKSFPDFWSVLATIRDYQG